MTLTIVARQPISSIANSWERGSKMAAEYLREHPFGMALNRLLNNRENGIPR